MTKHDYRQLSLGFVRAQDGRYGIIRTCFPCKDVSDSKCQCEGAGRYLEFDDGTQEPFFGRIPAV